MINYKLQTGFTLQCFSSKTQTEFIKLEYFNSSKCFTAGCCIYCITDEILHFVISKTLLTIAMK